MANKITQTTQEIAAKVYNWVAPDHGYSKLTEAERDAKLTEINAWIIGQNIFANGRNLNAMDLRWVCLGWSEVELRKGG